MCRRALQVHLYKQSNTFDSSSGHITPGVPAEKCLILQAVQISVNTGLKVESQELSKALVLYIFDIDYLVLSNYKNS